MMSLFLHIPYPERLADEEWAERVRQLEWLGKSGLLGVKLDKE